MRLKRKIVKRTHRDGHNSYVVKYRIWPFWFVDSWDYWYGPGICTIRAVFNTLEGAQKYIDKCNEDYERSQGEKIVKCETINKEQ